MAKLTVRNLPDELLQALRQRASVRGHSLEAEVCGMLATGVRRNDGLKRGSLFVEMGRKAQLSEAEFAVFEQVHDKAPAQREPR